jgi:hypothetical protein
MLIAKTTDTEGISVIKKLHFLSGIQLRAEQRNVPALSRMQQTKKCKWLRQLIFFTLLFRWFADGIPVCGVGWPGC